MEEEISNVLVGGGLRGTRLVLGHSQGPCNAKKSVKNNEPSFIIHMSKDRVLMMLDLF